MNNRFEVWRSRALWAVTVVLRFVLPVVLCVAFIVAAVLDYDRVYPNPYDHFTAARAIATIGILSATLLWLGWRFTRFLSRP